MTLYHKCKPMLLRRKYVDHRDLDFAFRYIPSSSRKKSTTWPDKKKLARQNNQAKISKRSPSPKKKTKKKDTHKKVHQTIEIIHKKLKTKH